MKYLKMCKSFHQLYKVDTTKTKSNISLVGLKVLTDGLFRYPQQYLGYRARKEDITI